MIRPKAFRTRAFRRSILITGASSGLGAGMARAFAAQGRDLALCARRMDRLEAMKAELNQRYRTWPLPSRNSMSMTMSRSRRSFRAGRRIRGHRPGHRERRNRQGARWAAESCGPTRPRSRPTSSRRWYRSRPRWRCLPNRGTGISCWSPVFWRTRVCPASRPPMRRARPGCHRWGVAARPVTVRPDQVTVLEPGYIESEMTAKSATTMLMADNVTGVAKMVEAIEKEKGRAIVPGWPWIPASGGAQGAAAPIHEAVRLIWAAGPQWNYEDNKDCGARRLGCLGIGSRGAGHCCSGCRQPARLRQPGMAAPAAR